MCFPFLTLKGNGLSGPANSPLLRVSGSGIKFNADISGAIKVEMDGGVIWVGPIHIGIRDGT